MSSKQTTQTASTETHNQNNTNNSECNLQQQNKTGLAVDKKKVLGNYTVGKTLGVGTFGKVKMGTHNLTGEKVAIKILKKDKILDVTDVERVSREIHILKLIKHPHIVQLYEIIETPREIFLIMEFISGGEVFQYIVDNNRLEEVEACKLYQEILSGIEYLHRLKIVHRDLKPENLMLDHKKNIKIVDFGLSNTYKKNELLKTACGSPCYAPPEMIQGKKYESQQVDIWSSGVILFALLCGFLPFDDQDTSELYKKILGGQYQIPDFVSEDAADLMKKILNTDPAKRYTFEQIKAHKWFQKYSRSYTIPPGIIVGYNRVPTDNNILSELQNKYSIKKEYTSMCIDANKHNHYTTSYHLLLKKHLMEGGESDADINSPSFDIQLLEPKPRPQKEEQSQIMGQDLLKNMEQSQILKKQESENSTKPTSIYQYYNVNQVKKQRSMSQNKNSGQNLNQSLQYKNNYTASNHQISQQSPSFLEQQQEFQHEQQVQKSKKKTRHTRAQSHHMGNEFSNTMLQPKSTINSTIQHNNSNYNEQFYSQQNTQKYNFGHSNNNNSNNNKRVNSKSKVAPKVKTNNYTCSTTKHQDSYIQQGFNNYSINQTMNMGNNTSYMNPTPQKKSSAHKKSSNKENQNISNFINQGQKKQRDSSCKKRQHSKSIRDSKCTQISNIANYHTIKSSYTPIPQSQPKSTRISHQKNSSKGINQTMGLDYRKSSNSKQKSKKNTNVLCGNDIINVNKDILNSSMLNTTTYSTKPKRTRDSNMSFDIGAMQGKQKQQGIAAHITKKQRDVLHNLLGVDNKQGYMNNGHNINKKNISINQSFEKRPKLQV